MSIRYFTNTEIIFLKENFIQYGPKYCAEKLNRNVPYVAKKAYALGLKRRNSVQWKIDKSSKQVNMEHFHNIVDPRIAYILGFIWADGYVSKTTNRVTISIQNKDGKDLKDLFSKHISFHLHISKRNKQYIFYLNDFSFHSFLVENNYINKSTATPSIILSKIPEKLKHYFFRGYFDGDGCLTNNTNHCLSFTGSYEQNWNDVENMILTITDHIPKIIRRTDDIRGHKSSFIYVYGKEKVSKILKYLYDGEQMGLTRKSHLSQEFLTNH